MQTSEPSQSASSNDLNPWCQNPLRVAVVLMAAACFLASPWASAQTFSVTMAPFPIPDAINPGTSTSTNVTVSGGTGFNATVDLACTVSPQPTVGTPPTCAISPASMLVDPSSGATVTVTGGTAPLLYTIMVTGTISGTTQSASQSQNLTVEAVSPQFTITVQSPVEPSSVVAGSGATGQVLITPLNGYTSPAVTLSCSAITPLVVIPPTCSFSPATVVVPGNPSILTITTYGPTVTTDSHFGPHRFYATWLPVPILMFAGLGVGFSGKRSRKVWMLFTLFLLSASVLLIPGCVTNGQTHTIQPNGVTPAGTYQFIIAGVDTNGNISSNAGAGSTNPTVTLTVTAPPAN